ncbi:uncharacterized protein LOC135956700 [Calliphora vicina]|uniref:uncharacterized protein LOC135956700 n=1 Tax=Calliphora vicina TaxID=7373 RepID=UPI00325A566A
MEIFNNNLCRSCNIEKQKLLNIHSNSQASLKLMLEYCFQTTITDESKYPKFICYDCVKQLEISYRFMKRFHLAQTEFEETYSHLQRICVDVNDDCVTEHPIDDTINEELEGHTMMACDDLVKHSISADKIIQKSPDIYLPLNDTKHIKLIHNSKASTSSSIIDSPSTNDNLPAITCSLCNKTFFTTKALNLHLKLSHKQKISNS